MYKLKLLDKKDGRRFEVEFANPYLLSQWKKKHKVPHSKRLVILSETKED